MKSTTTATITGAPETRVVRRCGDVNHGHHAAGSVALDVCNLMVAVSDVE